MLVDRGLLTREELDEVLTLQKESGRKLGEIIVERGFISGPTLALTLAEQWGVELTSDEGFGSGLRNEIQRRHEGERQRRPDLHAVEEPELKGHEIFPVEDGGEAFAEVSAQLAEDDARIVQLEARLVKQAEDRSQQEARIEELVAQETARIQKALMDETAKLAERFALTQKDLLAAAADWRAKHEAQIVKLLADKLGRLEAQLKDGRPAALDADDRQALERRMAELVTRELTEARRQLLEAAAKQRSEEQAAVTKLISEKLAALGTRDAPKVDETLEQRIADLIRRETSQLREQLNKRLEALATPATSQAVDLSGFESRIEKLDKRIAELDLSSAVDEKQLAQLVAREVAQLREQLSKKLDGFALPTPQSVDLSSFENLDKRVVELVRSELAETRKQLSEKLDAFEPPPAPEQTVDFSAHEERIAKVVAQEVARVEKALMSKTAQAENEIAAANGQLADKVDQLQASLEALAKRGERDRLAALGADLRATVKRLDGLEELVHTSTREIVERFEESIVAREPVAVDGTGREQEEEPTPEFSEHLLFAPADSGYALLTIDLPPPNVGAELFLGDEGERFVVTKVAGSPFPRDERPCAYVQRVS